MAQSTRVVFYNGAQGIFSLFLGCYLRKYSNDSVEFYPLLFFIYAYIESNLYIYIYVGMCTYS
jgi:hypothetical protein